MPDGYAFSDLQWPLERYEAARQQLVEADLICFNSETSVVMITRWFKHNPPMSESHLTGIERVLERIPSDPLREAAQEALQESWDSIEAQKVAKAQRKQKPAHGLASGPGGASSDRLFNTSLMRRTQGR